jgi:hypothetical protein
MHQPSDSLNGSKLPSERIFGIVFAGIFLILAGYGWYKQFSNTWINLFLVLASVFLLCTLIAPKLLRPLNKAWYKLGLFLGRFVSPIVLGILFFIVITPVAIVTRLAGRDTLRLRKQSTDSYWIDRKPPGPDPESFKQQF